MTASVPEELARRIASLPADSSIAALSLGSRQQGRAIHEDAPEID